ncbi:MAG: alpha/beta hydrolase family protein [Promethearchaeota archaeon]
MNKIKSNKKVSGILIALLITIVGLIPLLVLTYWADPQHPYSIKKITLVSDDGTKITALLHQPLSNDSKLDAGIVNAHGYCGNKQHNAKISIELVKRGFTVVTLDFRGHGSSDGYLGENRQGLYLDMMAAIKYLENLGYIKKFGLIGHSMGGSAAFSVAEAHPDKIKALVAIGSFRANLTPAKAPNLLVALGRFEQVATLDEALTYLTTYVGGSPIEVGKLYGEFSKGTAFKIVIGPTSEHLYETTEPTIVKETVKWFECAFIGRDPNASDEDIHLTVGYSQFFYNLALAGVVALGFGLIVYLRSFIFKKKDIFPETIDEQASIGKLYLLYLLVGLIGLLFSQSAVNLFEATLPVSSGDQLFALMVGTIIGILLAWFALTIKSKEKKFSELPSLISHLSPGNPCRSIVFGVISAILLCTLIALISDWNTVTTFLTVREIGTVIFMTFLFFPLFLMKEFYFRMVQSHLSHENRFKEYFSMTGIGIAMEITLYIPIMLLTWGEFLSLSLTVLAAFAIIQQILVTWVYMHGGRNIISSSVFLSILYGWMIVNFFPFGMY